MDMDMDMDMDMHMDMHMVHVDHDTSREMNWTKKTRRGCPERSAPGGAAEPEAKQGAAQPGWSRASPARGGIAHGMRHLRHAERSTAGDV